MLIVHVPTINDEPADFDRLFALWDQVNDDFLEVKFNFSRCGFLRQNAVAFLGGIARLIENRFGRVVFDWDTISHAIRMNLAQNGFLAAFGNGDGPWRGNSVPFREDVNRDKDGLTSYLRTMWLGRDWVHLSNALQNVIAGRVWEIYENAFEHGHSETGVFSCGQHYPNLGVLKLTIVDFGVGIPSNVRVYKGNSNIPAEKALEWAFQRGTTTKPNGMGRGLGLDILKQFVRLNKGRLEIFSHEAYGLIDEHRETYQSRQSFFEGTLVNITLRCDEAYYQLASEDNDEPLF
jgi:signal transduction histidine kinase